MAKANCEVMIALLFVNENWYKCGVRKALYKVPNGKLLKIFLEEKEGKISDIKITGDFFTYPEERIERLEQELKGTSLQATALTFRIREFFLNFPTELFGVDEESLVTTILSAQ